MKTSIPAFISTALLPYIGKTAKFSDTLLKAYLSKNKIPLSKEQCIVLWRLEDKPKQQTELAMITERNKGSLTRLVQSLEHKNYVTRKVCQQDNRVNWVALTADGRQLLYKIKPIVKEVFTKIERDISPADKEKMRSILMKIQQNAILELEELDKLK